MSRFDNIVMKNKRNEILGSNVKAERNRKHLSQFQLAEKINVSESTISLIERGLQTPSIFLILDISKVLNLNINELLKDIK